jgi:hypothetical protein
MASDALQRRLELLVTVDAKAHVKSYLIQTIHLLNLPMATLAGDVLGQMPEMGKVNVVGIVVNSNPRQIFTAFFVGLEFLYLFMIRNDIVVTTETLVHRGHPRIQGPLTVRMTIKTVYLLVRYVKPV